MCYPKPGPRCSAHAKADLDAKEARFTEVHNDPEHAFDAYHQMKEAEETFYTTPEGMKALAVRIEHASDIQKRATLQEKLDDAKKLRQALLTAYKISNSAEGYRLAEEDIERDGYTCTTNPNDIERLNKLAYVVDPSNTGLDSPTYKNLLSVLGERPDLRVLNHVTGPDSKLPSYQKFDLAVRYRNPEMIAEQVSGCRMSDWEQSRERVLWAAEELNNKPGQGGHLHSLRDKIADGISFHAKNSDDMWTATETFPYESSNLTTGYTRIFRSEHATPDMQAYALKNLLERSPHGGEHKMREGFRALGITQVPTNDAIPAPLDSNPSREDVDIIRNPRYALADDWTSDGLRFEDAQMRVDATRDGMASLLSTMIGRSSYGELQGRLERANRYLKAHEELRLVTERLKQKSTSSA